MRCGWRATREERAHARWVTAAGVDGAWGVGGEGGRGRRERRWEARVGRSGEREEGSGAGALSRAAATACKADAWRWAWAGDASVARVVASGVAIFLRAGEGRRKMGGMLVCAREGDRAGEAARAEGICVRRADVKEGGEVWVGARARARE
jgi:hypothetical protein